MSEMNAFNDVLNDVWYYVVLYYSIVILKHIDIEKDDCYH